MNSHVFLVGFIIYALAMIWLGWYVSRHQKSGEDFLLGGRSLPLFLTLGPPWRPWWELVQAWALSGSATAMDGPGCFTAWAAPSVFYWWPSCLRRCESCAL